MAVANEHESQQHEPRERWERHYSEKFGLDDRGANAGRDGGKSVEEWTKYYEEKYGLSK